MGRGDRWGPKRQGNQMQSQGKLLAASRAAGAMTSGFDVSAWDTPQVALFEALGEVVDTVGARNAAYHAHRISSHTPSREFLERIRRLEVDSKLAQEMRMLLDESAEPCFLPQAASEAEACQMRLRHLLAKEQILDTLSTGSGFVNQILEGIQAQYEGTDLQRLAEAMAGMREKVVILEKALGMEGEKITPEEMKNKVAEWRAKALRWDNYVTAAGKKSAEVCEAEKGEDVERLADNDGTDHTTEEPSATLIPISNTASPKPPRNLSHVEVKEDHKKQQAKLKKAIDANRLLQAKLRQVSDNRNRWSEYCEHLQKKLERSNALLKQHQVAKEFLKLAEPEKGRPPRPQTVEKEEATRAMMRENPHLDGDTVAEQQEVGITDGPANTSEEGYAQGTLIDQSDAPPDSASESLSPKLPRLLHTTTVPDSLASSNSVSQHLTSSTQAEHPTSAADTINAEEANRANAVAARPLISHDEPPVVVSERNIRKRKLNDLTPKKKIKQERIGSSPITLLGLRHLQTQESMDLDDIGPKTATPKKRREKQSAGAVSGVSEEYAPAQVYQQAPCFGLGRDEEDEEEAPGTPLLPKPSPSTPSCPPRAASILKPRSTNPILPRTSATTYSAKCGRISDNGANLFSEDGENHLAEPAAKIAAAQTSNKAVPRAVAGRLAGLLEKPSSKRWQFMNMDDEPDSASASSFISTDTAKKATPSAKFPIAPKQTVHERLAARRMEAQKSMKKSKQRDYESDNEMLDLGELVKAEQMNPLGSKTSETSMPVLKINSAARSMKSRNKVREDVPSTAKPEEEPFATRQVSRLSLDDFRINPEYNNGLDYAYRDVVRGREKRMCLAGCTDPSCCGKGFRALAEIANPIRENLTFAQKEEEDKLLTEFLGRDATKLLKHMGKEERRETLIRAKTRELANKHGRHRHAYERRKSPPGFWRADFPTTQEEAEDREKAKVFERDLVQKRYEEAMRGGGKWIFKDHMEGQPGHVHKE